MSFEVEPMTVNINGAVAMIGISKSEIYRLLAAGKITALKSGRSTLIPMQSLRDYLNSLPVAEYRAPPEG